MSGLFNRLRRKPGDSRKAAGNVVAHDDHEKEASAAHTKAPTTNSTTDDKRSDEERFSDSIPAEEEIEEDLRDYPPEVRNTVSFEDDTTLPTITFRYFVLTFVFVAPGAFLYQMVSTAR